jgi:hypothetical protein
MQKDHWPAATQYFIVHNGTVKKDSAQSLFSKFGKDGFNS